MSSIIRHLRIFVHPRSMYESNTLMYSISIQYCYICMHTTKVTTTSTPIRGTWLLLDILTVDKKYFGAVQPKCGLTVSVTESSLPDVYNSEYLPYWYLCSLESWGWWSVVGVDKRTGAPGKGNKPVACILSAKIPGLVPRTLDWEWELGRRLWNSMEISHHIP